MNETIKCPQCDGKGLWITENAPEGRLCTNCDGKGYITNPTNDQKMNLKHVAEETLKIVNNGHYYIGGRKVNIKADVNYSVNNTKVISPEELKSMSDSIKPEKRFQTRIEVTGETSQEAAERVSKYGKTILLNFASAKKPGGGFLNGRIAQEEDLCRCSALYNCLKDQNGFYGLDHKDALYSRHVIYSPNVPFFRIKGTLQPGALFMPSVLTSAAPNAGAWFDNGGRRDIINVAWINKIRDVLVVAKTKGYKNLVLGAWGCGVFRNDPKMVAEEFAYQINSTDFEGYFDTIVFPIYGDKDGMIKTFKEAFEDYE